MFSTTNNSSEHIYEDNAKLDQNISFKITIDGITDDNEGFNSIDGLYIGFQTQTYTPTDNSSTTTLASQILNQPLVLKRQMPEQTSPLTQWCINSISSGTVDPKTMHIYIFDVKGEMNNYWLAEQTYPVKLEAITNNDEKNDKIAVVEVITMMYVNLKRVK